MWDNPDRVCCIILPCCTLHNWSRQRGDLLAVEELGDKEQSSKKGYDNIWEEESIVVHDRAQLWWVPQVGQGLADALVHSSSSFMVPVAADAGFSLMTAEEGVEFVFLAVEEGGKFVSHQWRRE
eukprot:g43143.t1